MPDDDTARTHVTVTTAALQIGMPPRTLRHRCAMNEVPGAFQVAGYHSTWLVPIEYVAERVAAKRWQQGGERFEAEE